MTRRHHIGFVSLLTVLSGASLLSGCGLGATTGSSPAATVTPATATYTSVDGLYRLQYPTSWSYTNIVSNANSSDAVLLGNNANDNDQFVVQQLTTQIVTDYSNFLQGYLSDSGSNPYVTVETTTSTVSYPSGVWTVARATTVSAEGDPQVVRLYGIVHNGQTFLIVTYALSSSDTADSAKYFVPMLTSFTFLK
jgi:hypothetical protein